MSFAKQLQTALDIQVLADNLLGKVFVKAIAHVVYVNYPIFLVDFNFYHLSPLSNPIFIRLTFISGFLKIHLCQLEAKVMSSELTKIKVELGMVQDELDMVKATQEKLEAIPEVSRLSRLSGSIVIQA